MMAEEKRGSLSTGELEVLKSSGRLRLTSDRKPIEALKLLDLAEVEYLYNEETSLVGIPDLDLQLYGHELVYLPAVIPNFKPEMLKASNDLRTAVNVLKVIRLVKDPSRLTAQDLTVPQTAFDQLPKEVEHVAEDVLGGTNVYQEKLKQEEKKEQEMNEALAGGSRRPKPAPGKAGVRG